MLRYWRDGIVATAAGSPWYNEHSSSAEDVFWRCVIGNRTKSGGIPEPEYGAPLLDWTSGAEPHRNVPTELLEQVLRDCLSRQLITTSKGLVGFALSAARPGDKICVLPGCDTLIILRRIQPIYCEEAKLCKVRGLISDCLKAGCMDQDLIIGDESDTRIIVIGEACKCYTRIINVALD